MTYERSKHFYDRAASIAGRSLTRSKAPGRLFAVGSGPLYAMSGSGSKIYDVDGNDYIDMVCALGAVSLGYGRTEPLEAAIAELRRGWLLSLPSCLEAEAAEIVLAHVAPWASSVRFVKTGSEALHAAYRVAKVATGRSHVLVGDWAYHGWHEWCSDIAYALTHRFSHNEDLAFLDADGIFHCESHNDGHAIDYNDIAAVVIEPHRWEPVDVGWLRSVRAFCDRIGALLVFDEMIYGGRWALGGATEYFGIEPDMACFGKALGNSASIAFVAGREELAEHGEMVSGTYNGDAAALAALVETIKIYTREPVIDTLWARGRQLQVGLNEAVKGAQQQVVVEGMPVHQRLRFLDANGDTDDHRGQQFAADMAARGILWHPQVVNVSAAHSKVDIERVIAAAASSMEHVTSKV